MSAQNFESSLAFVLKWEGSKFTNDPDDHGGATRFGVTQREYDAFLDARGKPRRSVEHITMDEVREIYRREYWALVRADEMPAPLDLVLFDTGILMGTGRAARFLQSALGVEVDGDIGPKTMEALAAADAKAVARRCMELREAKLRAIVDHDPTQKKFLKGWLNRLNDLRATALPPAPGGPLGAAAAAADDSGAEAGPAPDEAVGRAVEEEDAAEAGFASADAADARADDPAAPAPGDADDAGFDAAEAVARANFGTATPGDAFAPPAAVAAAAPVIDLDVARARAFLDACTGAQPRVTYGLGAKVPFHGARPGKDFEKVDCSGFVRELIHQATTPPFKFPDGSVVQHDFIRGKLFPRVPREDAAKQDGAVRIAFLRPQDSPKKIGHVVIVHDGKTLESHGGVGPDSRPWTGGDWQAKAFVYLLRPA